MMARAASGHDAGDRRFAVSPTTPLNFSGSSGSPITPVEARNTSFGRQPSASATIAAESFTVSRPRLPVKALALPELTRSPRALPPESAALHQSTGADGHFERVKTPATSVPLSKATRSTSVRFRYLIPASAVARPMPAIGGSSGYDFGASGETPGIPSPPVIAPGRVLPPDRREPPAPRPSRPDWRGPLLPDRARSRSWRRRGAPRFPCRIPRGSGPSGWRRRVHPGSAGPASASP